MSNPDIVGIRFKPTEEVIHLETCGVPVQLHDRVLVRLDKGKDVAKVVSVHAAADFKGRIENVFRLLRKLTPEDLDRLTKNEQREREAFGVCESKIKKLRMPMKLLRVQSLFDGSRVTFFFKAANKVDFRQLVRQLAAVFKTRIELRQVGARDETELVGGIGICGREICCHYWSCRTVKWCRESGPGKAKMVGLCNRTLCCLKYESSELDSKHLAELKKTRCGGCRPGDAAAAGDPDDACGEHLPGTSADPAGDAAEDTPGIEGYEPGEDREPESREPESPEPETTRDPEPGA